MQSPLQLFAGMETQSFQVIGNIDGQSSVLKLLIQNAPHEHGDVQLLIGKFLSQALCVIQGHPVMGAEQDGLSLVGLRLKGNPIEIDNDDLALLSDLANLTSLDISDNNIRDITGIEGCVNLERLMLGTLYDRSESSNDVEDISLLKELTNLVELSLASNKVSNIEPLSGLTNLTWVNLNSNQITDAAPLAKLTNLEIR